MLTKNIKKKALYLPILWSTKFISMKFEFAFHSYFILIFPIREHQYKKYEQKTNANYIDINFKDHRKGIIVFYA